jgi:hypothetical protein
VRPLALPRSSAHSTNAAQPASSQPIPDAVRPGPSFLERGRRSSFALFLSTYDRKWALRQGNSKSVVYDAWPSEWR